MHRLHLLIQWNSPFVFSARQCCHGNREVGLQHVLFMLQVWEVHHLSDCTGWSFLLTIHTSIGAVGISDTVHVMKAVVQQTVHQQTVVGQASTCYSSSWIHPPWLERSEKNVHTHITKFTDTQQWFYLLLVAVVVFDWSICGRIMKKFVRMPY